MHGLGPRLFQGVTETGRGPPGRRRALPRPPDRLFELYWLSRGRDALWHFAVDMARSGACDPFKETVAAERGSVLLARSFLTCALRMGDDRWQRGSTRSAG